MVNSELHRAFQWFLPRVGGIVGQNAQTALTLARAERWMAGQDGIEIVWEADPDTDLGEHAHWCPNGRAYDRLRTAGASRYGIRPCDHEGESCALVRPCPDHGIACRHTEYLASLGGIIDADRDYRRIVAAELAAEIMDGGR